MHQFSLHFKRGITLAVPVGWVTDLRLFQTIELIKNQLTEIRQIRPLRERVFRWSRDILHEYCTATVIS